MNTLEAYSLKGRRAVVTGAAGLLGRQFTLALLEAGADVAMIDISAPGLEAALSSLPEALRARASSYVCDITSETSVNDTIAQIAAEGPISALVNSAAVDPKF